jgi:hypothetical protein
MDGALLVYQVVKHRSVLIHVGLIFKEPMTGFGQCSSQFARVISIIREPNAQCHVLIDRRHTQRRVAHLLLETVSQSASQILIGKSDHRCVNADRFAGCVAPKKMNGASITSAIEGRCRKSPRGSVGRNLIRWSASGRTRRQRFIKASTHSGVEPRITTRSLATSFQETPCSHTALYR